MSCWSENANENDMDLFTVSFFGHRIVPEFWKAEERVGSLIHTLLLEKEYVEFLVGRRYSFSNCQTGSQDDGDAFAQKLQEMGYQNV